MKLGWSTMLARLMMLLGVVLRLNSQAAAVHSDERVVFFPSLGWPSLGGWEVEVHGCVYEPEQRTLLLPLVRRALGIDDEELTPAEKAVFTIPV